MTQARIYVSSTFEDLKDYRAKVNEWLSRAGYEVMSQDSYSALDQRLLQRCLADVVSSDLYVGILAWRYGYIPREDNPQELSITELEYLEATRSGLPRLVFQLDPDTPWPAQFDDRLMETGDHGANIHRFRLQVAQELVVGFFSTPDELASLVLQAVVAWIKDRQTIPVHSQAPSEKPSQGAPVFDQPPSAPLYLVPESARDHDIIGRDDLLETLWGHIARGENCSLVGLAGVGKTAVAMELVRQKARILGHFEGVLWADLGKRPERLEQLRRWAAALGVASEDVRNLASLADWKAVVRNAIGARRLLLVLDDVWSVKDARDFAALGSACVTLLTTRLPQVAVEMSSQGHVLEVPELDETRGLQLLTHIAPHAVQVDPEGARELVDAVQGLPVALVLLGKYLRQESGDRSPNRIAKAFAALREANQRLTLRGDGGTLEEVIESSYGALPTEAARVALQHLSVFLPKPRTFSKTMARDICGVEPALLFQLAEMGLVERVSGGLYTMHRVIAEYARRKLPSGAAEELHRKVLEWYRQRLPGETEAESTTSSGASRNGKPQRHPPAFPPACACAWGDDRHGLWIDVELGGIVQRFRWIEPGEFWMGSPEGEPERFEDEGPRHRVRLTMGFWLADTACSQAVWQAVMGDNPSQFKDDPQNPVENVSWDEVQEFLRRVERQVPGVRTVLPTEAEWEYACRAGSDSAFNFGDTISPAQANYNGSHAYLEGPTGENRQTTVPVKQFEPNVWGLYQMHGNVAEWCADGLRAYDQSTPTDPSGPEGDEDMRAVRGGCWAYEPWNLRSACRNRGPRTFRISRRGFRFSLRATSP